MVGVPGKYKGMSPYNSVHTSRRRSAKIMEAAILAGLVESNATIPGHFARNAQIMVESVLDMNERLFSSLAHRKIKAGSEAIRHETYSNRELLSLQQALNILLVSIS